MTELKLGISPCPNDVFIFSGVLLQKVSTEDLRFHVEFHDVEYLNEAVQHGSLDVAKISVAAYPACRQEYMLLPCGGALGRGVGPLLLSRGSDAWQPERETLSPGRYTTANFLLEFYQNHTHPGLASLPRRYLPFDELYRELCCNPEAQGVVIHEKRFTYQADGLHCIADLGEFWEQKTGCPIPLGALAAKRLPSLEKPLTRIVQSSIEWARQHYDEAFALCRRYAQDLSAGVVESHIELYVNQFSYFLGKEGEDAISYFLNMQEMFAHAPAG